MNGGTPEVLTPPLKLESRHIYDFKNVSCDVKLNNKKKEKKKRRITYTFHHHSKHEGMKEFSLLKACIAIVFIV
jgi:hypothetical protein